MPLFAHHFVEIEFMGRQVPVGPAEHAVASAVSAVVLLLTAYGAYAAVRDCWRWRRRRAQRRVTGPPPV